MDIPDDTALLRALVEVAANGLAVVAPDGTFALVNGAAAGIFGLPTDALVGRPSPFPGGDPAADPAGAELHEDRRRIAWSGPDGRRRDLEYRLAPVSGGCTAVWFTDVTDARRQQERLTAITRAASSVADEGSLHATLDAVANEVVMTANMAAVQILALDDPREALRILGMAGFGEADDFTERLAACRRLGAHVAFMEALETGRPVVELHRKPTIMADPAWAPLHEFMDHPNWDSFVAMPLAVRGRKVGVINAYYLPGEDPGPRSLAFLAAMADHAAVAIDTAALLAQTRSEAEHEERRRLARDLHDSVVQQLFSMRMQAKALTAQLARPDADPERVRTGAQELTQLATSALADLRALVFELRPLDLGSGLVPAVLASAASVEARTGLTVDVTAPEGFGAGLGIDAQEDLYRIVQEAVHNVVKHAMATRVEVRFAVADGGLLVEVRDDGRGPGGEPAGRALSGAGAKNLGLVSMRERAERWGGRLAAGPEAGGGWTVRVSLPRRPGAEREVRP